MIEVIKDLSQLLWQRKQWWLYPVIISIVLIALLIIFGSSSIITPFVYSLF